MILDDHDHVQGRAQGPATLGMCPDSLLRVQVELQCCTAREKQTTVVVSGRWTGEPAANSNDKAQLTIQPAEPSYRTPNT